MDHIQTWTADICYLKGYQKFGGRFIVFKTVRNSMIFTYLAEQWFCFSCTSPFVECKVAFYDDISVPSHFHYSLLSFGIKWPLQIHCHKMCWYRIQVTRWVVFAAIFSKCFWMYPFCRLNTSFLWWSRWFCCWSGVGSGNPFPNLLKAVNSLFLHIDTTVVASGSWKTWHYRYQYDWHWEIFIENYLPLHHERC